MKILIAPDSFKESLSAVEVAQAIKIGWRKVRPQDSLICLPIGDGGEGTLDALAQNLGFEKKSATVTGPFGQPVSMTYARKMERALFEVADLIGLSNIPIERRNPLTLQTKGLGELIVYLANQGIQEFWIGVGGSATNDGGLGLAAGLGYEFFDKSGNLVEVIGENLGKVASISDIKVPSSLKHLKFSIITDVENLLCGPKGATYIFGGQKGLSPKRFKEVDQALHDFYQLANPEIFQVRGAGAGGGLAAAFHTFLGANLLSGVDFVLDQINFDELVKDADLVIVGEGRLDAQSLSGKAPIGVARRTPKKTPVLAICGSLGKDLPDLPFENIQAVFPIVARCESLEETFAQAKENLVRTSEQLAHVIDLFHKEKI